MDSAARVFSEKRYSESKLTDIANLAGIQGGSLYYHFDSRDALMRETLLRALELLTQRVHAAVDSLPSDATPLDRIRKAVHAHIAAALDDDQYVAAYIRLIYDVPDHVRETLKPAEQAYNAYLLELLAAAQEAGFLRRNLDLSLCLWSLLGSASATVDWYGPRPSGMSLDDLYRIFDRVFFDGLATNEWVPSARLTSILTAASDREQSLLLTTVNDGDTKERILNSAARVFLRKGYAAGKLSDIAVEAEITSGSFYHHFNSRDDLVEQLAQACMDHVRQFVTSSVGQASDGLSAIDNLAHLMGAHLLSQTGDILALIRVVSSVPSEIRTRNRARNREYLDIWNQVYQDAARAGDVPDDLPPSVVCLLLIGAVNGIREWFTARGHPSPGQVAIELISIAFTGLSTSEGETPEPKSSDVLRARLDELTSRVERLEALVATLAGLDAKQLGSSDFVAGSTETGNAVANIRPVLRQCRLVDNQVELVVHVVTRARV